MKEGVFRFYFLCTIYICICNSFHTVIRLVICVSDLKWFYNDGATEGQVWNTFRKIEIVFFSREEVFIQSFPFWVIDILYLVYVNDWIVSEVILICSYDFTSESHDLSKWATSWDDLLHREGKAQFNLEPLPSTWGFS